MQQITFAPHARAHSSIASWSVETQIESNLPNSCIVCSDQVSKGRDPSGTRFFKGIPLLPPLASISPAIWGLGERGGYVVVFPFGDAGVGGL